MSAAHAGHFQPQAPWGVGAPCSTEPSPSAGYEPSPAAGAGAVDGSRPESRRGSRSRRGDRRRERPGGPPDSPTRS